MMIDDKTVLDFFGDVLDFFKGNSLLTNILIIACAVLAVCVIILAVKYSKKSSKYIPDNVLETKTDDVTYVVQENKENEKAVQTEEIDEEDEKTENITDDAPGEEYKFSKLRRDNREFLDPEKIAENLISRGEFGVAARVLHGGSEQSVDTLAKKRMDIREVECLVYDKKYYEASKKAMDMAVSPFYVLDEDESRRLFMFIKALIDS